MQINLTPDLSLLAIMVIFLLNYLVVKKFFLQPVNQVLEARETEIRGADEVYEAALMRFSAATAEVESQVQTAKREAQQVRDRFRGEAAAHRNEVVEKTQGEARAMIADADQKLSADVATAREQIVRESDNLAKLAAERILGRAV
jgi:F-type H+-transporting ATPase subunit b